MDAFIEQFEVIRAFKETGQKSVFLTRHGDYGEVILKFGKSPSKILLDRTIREVEVQSSLTSIYYPQNYDFRTFNNFQFVIVEEYVTSKPLSNCYDLFTDPLPIINLLRSLVEGLDLIWTHRITHRDLKPDNILIRPNGSPVIIDLGIVLAKDMTNITPSFAILGPCTPSYAAPEQLKNRRADIDFRTDQFILGIDIVQLLGKGIHPFDPKYMGYGESIPENIVNGNWNKDLINETHCEPMNYLINKLLSP